MRKKLFLNNSSYLYPAKKMETIRILLFCLIILSSNSFFASASSSEFKSEKFQQEITGVVSDESGSIPGVR